MATVSSQIPLWAEVTPSTSQSSSSLSGYLKKQVAAQTEAELANLKSAYTKNVNALDSNASALPKEYDSARNSTAVQAALAKKAFDERASASGLSNGANGQAELARGSVLQNNLSALDIAQAEALDKIALQKANLQAEYENAIAAAKAKGEETLAGYLYQEQLRQQQEAEKAASYYSSSGSGQSSSQAKDVSLANYDTLLGAVATAKGASSKADYGTKYKTYLESVYAIDDALSKGQISSTQAAALKRASIPAPR